MFTLSFYIFLVGYTYLFGWLFNLDFNSFNNPIFYLLTIVSLLIGLILSFITQIIILEVLGRLRRNTPFDSKFNHKVANALLRFGAHLLRTKVIVTGKENIPKSKFVLISNHQENWDIMILKPIFRNHTLNFIGKETLRKLPVLGKWIVLLGNIFISKYADRSAAESIVKGIRQYKSGNPMGIFPEGKRSFGNELIEFKAGAFKLAMKPKADILIATQYDTCKILKKFPWKRYKVYVHIHPLVQYSEYEGMNSHEVSDLIRGKIQAQLDVFKKTVK